MTTVVKPQETMNETRNPDFNANVFIDYPKMKWFSKPWTPFGYPVGLEIRTVAAKKAVKRKDSLPKLNAKRSDYKSKVDSLKNLYE